MISDNISLFYNGIELSSELDDFNLFNVGIKNESHITMTHRKPKYNIDVCHESAFVTIYADSDFIPNSTDSVARMLAGRSSWYPSAYLQISNTDMSCFLSSIYVLMKTIDKDDDLTQRVIMNYERYLELYEMPLISKKSFASLLLLNQSFHNADRTRITISFYELIQKMKCASGQTDKLILSESNVLCNLLLHTTLTPQLINWTYAKKNMSMQKTFVIYSPLMLSKTVPPVLTVDANMMISVYVGTHKDVSEPITLYQLITDTETHVNPAIIAKNINLDMFVTDDRNISEAIIVCIDTSGSMGHSSDFEEDLRVKKKNENEHIKSHYKIWDDVKEQKNILPEDIRSLKNAVLWFITHPNLSDWRKKYHVLRQIVCLENYTGPEIALYVSKYRSLFTSLLNKKNVIIDNISYSDSVDTSISMEIPPDYICPISLEIMTDPVVLDDGFSYDKKEIEKWLEKSNISPLTKKPISKTMIPNRTLRSTITSWVDVHSKNKIQNVIPSTTSIQIIRENKDSLYYNYQPDDNIYDLIYYLQTVGSLFLSQYVLKTTDGVTVRNKSKKLSTFDDRILLQMINQRKIEIKICFQDIVTATNTKSLSVLFGADLKTVIYTANTSYNYNRHNTWINLKKSGDNMYNGVQLPLTYVFTESITIHIYDDFPVPMKSNNYFSRLDIVKKLFDVYIDRSIAYGFNTAIGLMQFNDTSQLICPITMSYENFRDRLDDLSPSGGTALYDCIEDAITHLIDWKKINPEKKENSKLRIICLSDGANTVEAKFCAEMLIKAQLRKHSIILDCILIGNEYDTDLISMSKHSLGYIFKPSSITYGFNMVELETFISSTNRNTTTCGSIKENHIPPMLDLKPKKILTTNPVPIQKELSNLMKYPHPDIDIYVSEDNIGFWKIVFAGPTSTPYHNGCWLAHMQFPPTYPLIPPEIRMITPIKHCNINCYGRICHSVLDRNYVSTISVKTILECIYGLFLNPDVVDPLDTNLTFMYYEADGEYEATIMNHLNTHAMKTREVWRYELSK